MRCLVVAVLLVGCGRVSFDPMNGSSTTDATFDGPRTVHTGLPYFTTVLGVQGAMPTTMFNAWITSHTNNRGDIAGNTTITDANLAQTELIVLIAPQRLYTAPEAQAIAKVVERGGALLVVSGYEDGTDRDNANAALSAMNVSVDRPITLDGPVTNLAQHPITANVVSLPFSGGYRVTAGAQASPLGEVNGIVVGYAYEHQLGRAMVWGDEFVTFDSQWSPDVTTFWDNAFDWVWPTQ
jgi:hypothetical protein